MSPLSPGTLGVPRGLPLVSQTATLKHPAFASHFQPLFSSFPAIPVSQIFPISTKAFCTSGEPGRAAPRCRARAGTPAFLDARPMAAGPATEERPGTRGRFRCMGQPAWAGRNPAATQPSPQGCPGPTRSPTATDRCGPTGLPGTLPSSRGPRHQGRGNAGAGSPCLQLPAMPLSLTEAGGGVPDPKSLQFPGAGIGVGTDMERQLHVRHQNHQLAWGGDVPPQTRVLLSGTLLPRPSRSQSLGPILTLETWPSTRQ